MKYKDIKVMNEGIKLPSKADKEDNKAFDKMKKDAYSQLEKADKKLTEAYGILFDGVGKKSAVADNLSEMALELGSYGDYATSKLVRKHVERVQKMADALDELSNDTVETRSFLR